MHSRLCTLSFILSTLLAPLSYAGDAILTWNPNTEPDLAGYKVYQGTISGQYGAPVDVGNVTTYALTLPKLVGNQAYFWAITAYDKTGNESGKSNEVSKLIPGIPPVPALLPPTNFTAVTTNGQTTLSWDAMPGASGYLLRVHLAGTPYDPCSGLAYCGPLETVTSKTLTLPPGTYDAWVHSATSNTVFSTSRSLTFTIADPDTTPPATPTHLTVQ